MDSVKNVMKVIAVILGFGLWIVACPEVERYEDQRGDCYEAVTYGAVYTKVGPCD